MDSMMPYGGGGQANNAPGAFSTRRSWSGYLRRGSPGLRSDVAGRSFGTATDLQAPMLLVASLLVVRPGAPSSFLLLVVRPGASSASLLLVVRPGAPSSFLLLVVRPGASSSVLARSKARSP